MISICWFIEVFSIIVMNPMRYSAMEQNKATKYINKENYVRPQWWFGFQLKEVELDEALPIKGKKSMQ